MRFIRSPYSLYIFWLLAFFFCLFLGLSGTAQPSERKLSPKEYVESHKEDAIKEMLMFGIPASITLAQGMLESDNGNSDLAVYANNHFGIKCHEDWTGPSFIKDDDAKDECFRKYTNVLESYSDHSRFLKSRNRYASLFELKTNDYQGWAKGLKETGYATDPRYAERLLEIIDRNKLYEYDRDLPIPGLQPQPDLSEKLSVKSPPRKRNIQYVSERPFVIVKAGDTFSSLALEFEKGTWELPRYNELDKHAQLHAGQKIYLGPKRRKGSVPFHMVKPGETMYSISQDYCIKLKWLYRKNNMVPGTEPVAGDILYLRKHKKH